MCTLGNPTFVLDGRARSSGTEAETISLDAGVQYSTLSCSQFEQPHFTDRVHDDAVTKMIIKGRSRNMRHISRTHRVDLDGVFDRVYLASNFSVRYVNTKEQIKDILTRFIYRFSEE